MRKTQVNMDWTWRALVVDDDPLDVELLRIHAAAMRGPHLLLDVCSDPEQVLARLRGELPEI